MKNSIRFFQNINWFYISLVIFAISLPISESFISISAGLLFFFSLLNFIRKKYSPQVETSFLWISAIYLLFIIGFIFSANYKLSAYDLKKNLVFFVIPLSFFFGSTITSTQKRHVFLFFCLSVVFAAFFALLNYWFIKPAGIHNIHNSGFISHIRFSFQLILSFWFLLFFIISKSRLPFVPVSLIYLSIGFILFFIFYQQSLTGVIAFLTSILFFFISQSLKFQNWKKWLAISGILLVIIIPLLYTVWIVHSFYDIEKISPDKIDKFTPRGNPYIHDFNDPMVENGKYVYLYVCDDELRVEWNKLSSVKYDSVINDFPLKFNLIRYLTSKGVRKDADGIKILNQNDISNVERGMSNHIFSGRKFSLYPRIYQTIWEYYIFTKTGYVNYQSFSQRIEYVRAATSIIKRNFWFGVGTGDWKHEFERAYHDNGSQLKPELYGSSHNQYLNYLVKFGITGLLLILFCIIYPILKKRKYNDPLFLLFLVFMAIANIGDSNFESHVGGAFFVFFYCVFLSGNGMDYLINKDENNNRPYRFDL